MEKKFITLVLAYEGDMPEIRLEDKVLGCEVFGMSIGDEIEKRNALEEQSPDDEQCPECFDHGITTDGFHCDLCNHDI